MCYRRKHDWDKKRGDRYAVAFCSFIFFGLTALFYSGQIEAVEVHNLVPCRHKILNEFLF